MPKISLGNPKLHRPKAGDEPFLPSGKPRSEARLDMVYRTLGTYALAYKEAADCIIRCALRRRAVYPDREVLPAAFLYRHYLELKLKEIICRGQRLCGGNASLPAGHELLSLWKRARPFLEELWPEQDRMALAVVENCVTRFDQVDRLSQDFRYPTDRKGSETLRSLARVDIRNLKRVMAGVAGFLDGCVDGIDYLNSNQP